MDSHHVIGFLGNQPLSLGDWLSKSHLLNITKDTFLTLITQEIPGVLGAVSRKRSTTTEHNKRCSRHCHHFGSDQLRAGNRGPRPTYLFSTVLRGDRQTQTHKGEKSVRRWRQRLARRDDKRRNTTHCCPQWELHGAGRTLPCALRGAALWGHEEGIDFYCFQPPGLWPLSRNPGTRMRC